MISASASIYLNILGAAYGKKVVTDVVRSYIQGNALTISADDKVFGDTWPGNQKTLVIVYQYGNYKAGTVAVTNGKTVSISPPDHIPNSPAYYSPQPRLLGAAFGPADVTDKLQALVNQNQAAVSGSDSTFGDSWYGIVKTFVVVYQDDSGTPVTLVLQENQSVDTSLLIPKLRIIKAAFGLGDVTDAIQKQVDAQGGKKLDLVYNEGAFPDTWPGVRKALVIVYQYANGAPQLLTAKGGDTIKLSYQKK